MLTLLLACGPGSATPRGGAPSTSDTGSPWKDGPVDGLALARAFRFGGEPRPCSVVCTLADDPLEVHRVSGEGTELVVYGLLADAAYDCVLSDGQRAAGRSFRTDPLPADLPELSVTGAAPDGGYTLFNHGRRGQRLIVVDADGRIRWYYAVPSSEARSDLDASWLGQGQLLYGGAFDLPPTVIDLAGTVLARGPSASTGGRWHHHAEALASGEVVALAESANALGGEVWTGASVELLDPTLATTRSLWDTQRGVDEGWLPIPPDGDLDPYHANAVVLTADRVYVNFRKRSELVALDRAMGTLLWRLGPDGGDFALVDGHGAPAGPEDWFYQAHAPEIDGDRILLYDNGVARPGGSSSRVVELALDEVARTAQVVWEWSEPGWFEIALGDVDRLPGGHVLVTRAHCAQCEGSGPGTTQLVEIDPETLAVVWRLELPDPDDAGYRAERIDACAIFANAKYCPDPV